MSDEQNISPLPLGEGSGVRAVGAGRRPPSPLRPYVQVALTYLRRPLSSGLSRTFTVIILAAFGVGLLMGIFSDGRVHTPDSAEIPPQILEHIHERYGHNIQIQKHSSPRINLIMLLNGYLLLLSCTIVHLRETFANANNHLTPQYRRVNAQVAAVVIVLFAVVLPLIESWIIGFPPLVLLASTVSLFGYVLMSTSLKSMILAVSTGLISMAWMFSSMTEKFQVIYTGKYDTQLYCAIAAGVAMILYGGYRMTRPSEKLLQLQQRINLLALGKKQTTGEQPGVVLEIPYLNDVLEEKIMKTAARRAKRSSVSIHARLKRWDHGIGIGWLCLVMFMLLLIFMLVHLWISGGSKSSRYDMHFILVFSYVMLLVAAGLAPMMWCRVRRPALTHLLLLPVRRKDFIRQQGIAAALRHTKLSIGCILVFVLVWLIVFAETFNIPCLVFFTITFLAWQAFIFGVVVNFAKYQIAGNIVNVFIASLTMIFFPMMGEMIEDMELPRYHELVIWFYAILFLFTLGLSLSYIAYRRWLAADID